ncbi:YggN family protein [Winogradskyella jejuensis]|uniref:Adhesin domain-containing protein n=1 Tax=Winogradskyella jejuensis TaxID=1089305 RepID=A0A1M5SGT3_9FLAO|nr:hypothetical protein [Winogradskyella jejuensis]SHH37812.1 hypothetical protein SAMN05444148_1866 [Winogradskyella jejuensis]
MKTIKILMLCLITTIGFAQKKETKTSQSINVNKDVVVDLNTNYVEIEIETWNKNVVEVEAYLESSKLSQEELKKALDSWRLNIDATSDEVKISSMGGSRSLFPSGSYDDILKDLEFSLADLPDIPEMRALPNMPKMADFPNLPEMPKMPEFPELPELPEGVNTIQFDYDKYQKDGEKYLAEWSKKYEKEGGKELQKRMEEWAKKFAESGYQEKMAKWGEEYGKRFEGQWAKDMEKWGEEFGEKFGKDMEKWGEEFGEKFGKDMEKWGERLEKQMEKKAKAYEKRAELMEERAEKMSERLEQRAKEREERAEELANRREEMQDRRESIFVKRYESARDSRVKRVIKIKMPKKAKLKLNVRHGELKIASAVHDARGDVSHTFLLAENIDGSNTSINISYSPVVINNWNVGSLNLNFVENAQIKNANNLMLTSKSSNIIIDNLTETGIIDGSFGDLTISNLAETFKNLNLVLENSDAHVEIPENVNYNLFFNGNRSKYNNQPTKQKTLKRYDGKPSSKTIVVNAKYSNVTVN